MKTLLFDLDGTLSNNQQGIIGSIQYALGQLTDTRYADDELLWCIGPPLQDSFGHLLQTDDEATIALAMSYFRETYTTTGIFQNELYAGIEPLLQQLVDLDRTLYVATSKPQVYAQRIIEHFGLAGFFVGVYGCELDGTRKEKADLIGYILPREKLEPQATLMIGDRKHDMIGAKAHGLTAIGVLWGFGKRAELEANGAEHLIHKPHDLLDFV